MMVFGQLVNHQCWGRSVCGQPHISQAHGGQRCCYATTATIAAITWRLTSFAQIIVAYLLNVFFRVHCCLPRLLLLVVAVVMVFDHLPLEFAVV